MLGLSEVAGGYETYAGYIRTYRNTLPDDMTRAEWRRATSDLEEQGFTRISIGKAWPHYLSELEKQFKATRAALYNFGDSPEDAQLAKQLAVRRGGGTPLWVAPQGTPPVLLELFSSTGSYATHALPVRM